MGMPVKLSDDLVRAARAEAKAADRSITAQIEHWAKLGRAAQKALSQADALALQGSVAALDQLQSGLVPSTLQRLRGVLNKVAQSSDRSTVLAELQAGGEPLFEAHPTELDRVVRVSADGTRTVGRVEDGQFVAVGRARRGRRV